MAFKALYSAHHEVVAQVTDTLEVEDKIADMLVMNDGRMHFPIPKKLRISSISHMPVPCSGEDQMKVLITRIPS